MQFLGQNIEGEIEEYLKDIDTNWQPSDFLPKNNDPDFTNEIKEIQEQCRELPYDYMAVLVGDIITEEALPTYESWLIDIEGISKAEPQGWSKWIRRWTAEENRHGDLLNKYIYLSGRVDMKQMEITTQHLIADGMEIGTARDPYRNFVYTSFQELATNISHRRTATIAKNHDNVQLSKICGVIAADEMRHAKAYKSFVTKIFELDPSEMMLAFQYMMKQKIVMPAQFLRESGEKISSAFEHFSDSAQRIGVYTANDYVEIMQKLIDKWEIDKISNLTDEAEKARDYLMKLPSRMAKISERLIIPQESQVFKWVEPARI